LSILGTFYILHGIQKPFKLILMETFYISFSFKKPIKIYPSQTMVAYSSYNGPLVAVFFFSFWLRNDNSNFFTDRINQNYCFTPATSAPILLCLLGTKVK